MKDFHFYAPTEVVFGTNAEDQLTSLIKKYAPSAKVLLHYGGRSAIKSGLIARTEDRLKKADIPYILLGGVQPNPRLSLVKQGAELCKSEGVNFVLAVGGGSVIDSSKAIAYGALYDGDLWDFWIGKTTPTDALPVGCILTLPAAGSEMSDCSVISNEDTRQKLGYSSDIARPKFAIMNPELTTTLPPYQTACGGVDIMMHTMERYFTKDTDMLMHTAISEALLRTVAEATDALMREPGNLRYRAAMMWAGSWAHNDFTGTRNMADFATHKMEHELSALFDVAHGAGLAALWPSWARYVMDEDISRFASFAVNVMGVTCDFTDMRQTALRGIEAMEGYYRRWGMPTSIPELIGRRASDEEIALMADKCTKGDTFSPGYFKSLRKKDVEAIYRLANE